MRIAGLTFVLMFVAWQGTAIAASGDVAGGYSFVKSVNTGGGTNPNGWFATVGFEVAHGVDLIGDFSGAYRHDDSVNFSIRAHTYLFGPRLRWTQEGSPLTVFGQVVVGGQTGTIVAGPAFTDTTFAWAPGGGLDLKFGKRWSARGGINLLLVHNGFFPDWGKNVQIVSGLSYRWSN